MARGKGELVDYLDSTWGEFFVATENEPVKNICRDRKGVTINEYSYHLADGVECSLEGEYNRYNIATAVAIGDRLGVGRSDTLDAIAQYRATNNRSQRVNSDQNTLIIDCYNANPSSMEVAIANIAKQSEQRRVLILGDMYELGDWSADEHLRILKLATESGAERVLVVGSRFAEAQCLLSNDLVECYAGTKQLSETLSDEPIEGVLILLKGSRSVLSDLLIIYK